MILLGMTFIVAGTGKLISGSTAFSLYAFPSFVPPALAEAIYLSLPYIELVAGTLLILGFAVKFAASLSVLLILGFAVSNILLINHGMAECASCFGVAGSLTPTASLFLDGMMAAMAIVVFLCHRGGFLNKTFWFLEPVQKTKRCEYV